ncbi:hypothetical protein EVAR_88903_1 [Eumeta japonica]|uniref:Uncharacterized protein n=1 Tax=Eumeta variegata TaxID=151549 RepID=A0A4C1VR27_EUMVA|nr:hypothetical protein EVAR_88903_1 [Eumeta japonica]
MSVHIYDTNTRYDTSDRDTSRCYKCGPSFSGAFDNAWWPMVLTKAKRGGLPPNLYRLLTNYFVDRKVGLIISTEVSWKRSTMGCPAGGSNLRLTVERSVDDFYCSFYSQPEEGRLQRLPTVRIGGDFIRAFHATTVLGVVIDDRLSFAQHALLIGERAAKFRQDVQGFGCIVGCEISVPADDIPGDFSRDSNVRCGLLVHTCQPAHCP